MEGDLTRLRVSSVPSIVKVLLARLCAGTPRINHILRCLPHDDCADAVTKIDEATADVVASVAGERREALPPQMRWPLRFGGLGLTAAIGLAPAARHAGGCGTVGPQSPPRKNAGEAQIIRATA